MLLSVSTSYHEIDGYMVQDRKIKAGIIIEVSMDMKAFMKNYSNLPEILKRQPRLKESDIEWFLAHCGWNLR